MTAPRLENDVCTRCGACVDTCSERVLAFAAESNVPSIVRPELCIACGHCVDICPVSACHHDDMGPGEVCDVDSALTPSPDQVLELLRTRRSVRQFKPDPVTREELERLLEAARHAPSAHNYQTTKYVVVQDPTRLAEISRICVEYYQGLAKQLRNPLIRSAYRLALTRREVESAYHLRNDFDLLAEQYARGEDPILHRAPCLIVSYAEESVNYPEANATLALHNVALMAHAMGLGAFLLGYVVGCSRRSKVIPKMLAIPEGHFVTSVLAVGKPAVKFLRWSPRRAADVKWM